MDIILAHTEISLSSSLIKNATKYTNESKFLLIPSDRMLLMAAKYESSLFRNHLINQCPLISKEARADYFASLIPESRASNEKTAVTIHAYISSIWKQHVPKSILLYYFKHSCMLHHFK